MADALKPISGGGETRFCSWAATLVDALDTLWIMELKEEFEEAVNGTVSIDFKHNAETCEVNLFESTIRYLGGMLAAYDLSHESRLLPKLVELGDLLIRAFNTTNGMPCSHCHLASDLPDEQFEPVNDAALADVGSLTLEFSRLSQITGDNKYIHTIDWLSNIFANAQNDSSIPGLFPERLDTTSIGPDGNLVHKSWTYSLGALSDSSYEYLVKSHALMGGLTPMYRDMWTYAAQQIRRFLLFRAFIPDANETDILFTGIATRYDGAEDILLEPRTEHLACFAGGLFGIASKIFNEPDDLEIGKQLTQGCVWAYQHSPTGIMPETFTMMACQDLDGLQCEYNQTEFEIEARRPKCDAFAGADDYCPKNLLPDGWLSSLDAKYNLRPEAIESVFIMWRITGDKYWRDIGWEMFESIIKHTRTPFGHSALRSVLYTKEATVVEGGVMVRRQRAPQADEMESFWFAETLKYFWLLFSEVDLISLDDYVLNTEAHPLRLTEGSRGF